MSPKEMYLQTREREFATTMKVFKAYPHDKHDFKPHERSRSAIELVNVLANEELANKQIIDGKVDWNSLPQDMPATFGEALEKYAKNFKETQEYIKGKPEEDFAKIVNFAGMEMPRIAALQGLFFDTIHHRGQFSVYLRMAGGKVPSIYGPSADEPGM
jgi:uncharacterized damage-inducible protein DinB